MTNKPLSTAISPIVAVPTLFVVILFYNGAGHSLHVLSLWGLLLLIWYTASILKQDLFRLHLAWGWLTIVTLAYLGWLFIAPFISTYPSASSSAAWALAVLPLTLLVWLISSGKNWHETWRSTWPLLLAVSAMLAIWGIIDFLLLGSRSHGPLIDANAYGALINLFLIPVVFAFLVTPSNGRGIEDSRVLAGLILLFALAQFMSLSRGALLSLLGTLPLVLWLGRRGPVFGKRLAWVLLILACAYSFVKLGPFDQRRGIEVLLAAPEQQLQEDPALSARVLIWKSTWRIIQDANPLVGTGLGTYKTYYVAYREELETSGNLAHNDYLQALQEGGLIQLGFFLVLTVFAPIALAYRLRKRPDEAQSAIDHGQAAALMLAVLCVSLHAVINFVHYVAPIALLTGFYLARAWQLARAPREFRLLAAENAPLKPGFAKGLMITLLALPTAALLVDGVIFKVFSGKAPLLSHVDVDTRQTIKGIALVLRPGNPVPRVSLIQDLIAVAELNRSPDMRKQALDWAEREANVLVESAPALATGRFLRGKVRAMRGTDDALHLALNDLEFAVARVPPATGMRLELIRVYQQLGQDEKAYETVRAAKEWMTLEVNAAPLLAFATAARPIALKHGDRDEAEFWTWVASNVRASSEAGG